MKQMNWRTEMERVNRGKTMKEEKGMKAIHTKKMMEALESMNEARQEVSYNTRQYYDSKVERYADESKRWREIQSDRLEQLKAEAMPLTNAIDAAEGRASSRVIDFMDVLEKLAEIFREIDISKRAMDGVTVDVDIHAQPFPNAYKYTPMSTQFRATYKRGEWVITDIRRDRCRYSGKQRVHVIHTDASRAALIDKFTWTM